MDNLQWSQENRGNTGGVVQDEKHGINCKRCSSTNTKFCYYNNYSLSQPRYFCKTCKRYWTEGGSLRNIPVGGISRKNMKRISSPSSPPPKKMILQSHHNYNQNLVHQVPRSSVEEEKRQDLNLGLIIPSEESNMLKTISELIQVPDFDKDDYLFMPAINSASMNYHQLGSFHGQEDTHMMRRPAVLFPFQEIKQVEKSSDAGGYRINNGGGVLGSGLW